MITLNLSDCLEALEFSSDEMRSCVNIKTGEIILITSEAMSYAEDDTSDCDYPDWMHDAVENAKKYLNNLNDFIEFPDKQDLDEYRCMKQFALDRSNVSVREKLLNALSGKGAYSRFKNAIYLCGCANEWYAFREKKMKAFILEWCEDNGFKVEK